MNPLLFTDWGKIHRWFRNLAWWIVAIGVVVIIAASSANHQGHSRSHTRVVIPR